MIQRSEIGKRCREYFLNIEQRWNSPEMVMICCRELLLLGIGAANSTSIFGHKNNRQTMYADRNGRQQYLEN